MANIIKLAGLKQRSLVIRLLDLKNAFGTVHHNLIREVLKFNHIPNHIRDHVLSLYTNFQTSMIAPHFQFPFLHVGRGVLQGNYLNPQLFNLCLNTFIQPLQAEKYKQFGFSCNTSSDTSFITVHWFQFADDAAGISGQEQENQILLNRFIIWCKCVGMKIRVDKCVKFGTKNLPPNPPTSNLNRL